MREPDRLKLPFRVTIAALPFAASMGRLAARRARPQPGGGPLTLSQELSTQKNGSAANALAMLRSASMRIAY